MKSIISHIKSEIVSYSTNIINLYNSDFERGTYRILKPGIYKLGENIIFNPNSGEDWFPTESQLRNEYSSSAFFLGFFAAITVETSNVCIDLNGYQISQSPMHALKQRFFQTIELNSSPFLLGEGPTGTFANSGFVAAKNVWIKNGTIGLTSHYAIHGNNNCNVYISSVKINNFETGGIALNQIENLVIKKCYINSSRIDTPVTAFFSVLRFILKTCKNEIMTKYYDFTFRNIKFSSFLYRLEKLEKTVSDNYINSGFQTVLSDHEDAYNKEILNYIHNKTGINDGSSIVGIQITPKGVAINGFDEKVCPHAKIGICDDDSRSKNVFIVKTSIYNINSHLDEIVACMDGDKPVAGVMGELPDFEKFVDENGHYRPTIINDAQFCFGKLANQHRDELPLCTSYIPEYLIKWAEDRTKLSDAVKGHEFKLRFGFDIMGHTNKGVVGLRLGGTHDITLSRVRIHTINNNSAPPKFCTLSFDYDYVKSVTNIEQETNSDYIGNFTFGILFSNCKDIKLHKVAVGYCTSKTGKFYDWFYNVTEQKEINFY